MEDGTQKNLTELNWFKFANMSGFMDRQPPFPGSDHWTILAPPKFCPFHFYFWRGQAPGMLQMNCNNFMKEKLSFLPLEIQNICRCEVILETSKTASNNDGEAIWNSYNDEVINSTAFSIERRLIQQNQVVDVILKIGGASGLYSYKGERICAIEGDAGETVDMVLSSLKNREFDKLNFPVNCFNRWSGRINAEGLSYNIFKRRITGPILIELEGEKNYVLEEY